MGKQLIIAEKPSVAAAIAGALGGFSKKESWFEREDAIISNAIGHLVRLTVKEPEGARPRLQDLPVIPDRFTLVPSASTKSQLSVLQKLMARADVTGVINACDAGREGELIFRLIYEFAGCRKPMLRMWMTSMTSESIRSAYRDRVDAAKYDNLNDAARCRSESDWLVGINGSRALLQLYSAQTGQWKSMSAGRVQTPTLSILVSREHEITQFVPKDYWEVLGVFGIEKGTFGAKWHGPNGSAFDTQDAAQAVLDRVKNQTVQSIVDEAKPLKVSPPALFDLTTLQRLANRKFKFSAKKTLDIAQALYETHKATTYPRTDSSHLPEDYVPEAVRTLSALSSPSYSELALCVVENNWCVPNKRIFDNSKISDHFAIIPTGSIPAGLNADEQKVFDLIVRRFIAAFYPDAEFLKTTRTVKVADETFKTSGKVVVSPGWNAVYGGVETDPNDEEAGHNFPALTSGETGTVKDVQLKASKTKPPSRYTEDTLLSAMEGAGKLIDDDELRAAMKAKGLGTPATRAAIIEGLQATKSAGGKAKEPYVTLDKKHYLTPTEHGITLIDFLNEQGVDALTSPRLTGEWECQLLAMEKGRVKRSQFMADIATQTREMMAVFQAKAATITAASTEYLPQPCPQCGERLIIDSRTASCEKQCGVKVWRTLAGHVLTATELTALFAQETVGPFDDFVSSAKKSFSASVRLKADFSCEFIFADRPVVSGQATDVPCPKCEQPLSAIEGDYPSMACVAKPCDFRLFRTIAGRKLTVSEASILLTKGALPSAHGYKSKAGKLFTAALRYNPAKQGVDFVFED